jgi:pyruvate/2-oxoglutarate dehydrogenase complex dihydrolipoamide acyltransferase (E2) component
MAGPTPFHVGTKHDALRRCRMSRFSRKAAEELGWSKVHERKEEVVGEGLNKRVLPAEVRYRKVLNGVKVVEQTAETEGLVLEKINQYEVQWGTPLEGTPEPQEPPQLSSSGVEEEDEVDATDAAKKLAADSDLDLSQVEGTGKDGRITKEDVEDALTEYEAEQESADAEETPES